MSTLLTAAGESLIASLQAQGNGLVIDTMILALIPDQDHTQAIDPGVTVPDEALIALRYAIPPEYRAYVNPNQVVYSAMLGSDMGDFPFNWQGLYCSEHDTLVAVATFPALEKRKYDEAAGTTGNNLTRNFLLTFTGARELTGLTISAAVWQLDFTVRLNGIDERERLSNYDIYGQAYFEGDGWLLGQTAEAYAFAPGLGYVGGIRAYLAETLPLAAPTAASLPQNVWLDGCLKPSGSDRVAEVSPLLAAVGATLASSAADETGLAHFRALVARIEADGTVTDLRPRQPALLTPHDVDATAHAAAIAAHEAKDPAHPASRVSYDNTETALPGDPDRVQDAFTAVVASMALHEVTPEAHANLAVTATGSSQLRTLQCRCADSINLRDFGARGTGDDDDTDAIQSAVNYACTLLAGNRRVIYLPSGIYNVSRTIMVPDCCVFIGDGVMGGGHSRIDYYNPCNADNLILFKVLGQNTHFRGLWFNQVLPYSDASLLEYSAQSINYDMPIGATADTDGWISECYFRNFWEGIRYKGRGLNVANCEFGAVRECIVLDWPNSGDYTPGTYGYQTDHLGFRGFNINNVRFHSAKIGVRNDGANASKIHGLSLSNVYADTGVSVFYGVLCDSHISNVTVNNQTVNTFSIFGGSHDYVIDGISSIGSIDATAEDGTVLDPPNSHISLNGDQKNVRIDNFLLKYSKGTPISCANNFTGDNIHICDGTIARPGYSSNENTVIDQSTVYQILLNGLITNSSVRNVSFITAHGDTFSRLIYISNTNSQVHVSGITKNSDIPVVLNIDSAQMRADYIAGVSGWRPFLTALRADNSVAHQLQSYDGGGHLCATAPHGNIFVAPSDDNGYFGPLQDNVSGLGSNLQRWSQIFAGTATISTSDERMKDQIAAVPEAVLRAWGQVALRQFLFVDAVAAKGDAARLHTGIIAQQLLAAFGAEGLDATRYGLLCYDEWQEATETVTVVDAAAEFGDDGTMISPEQTHEEQRVVRTAGNRYGIRYEEALIIEAAYQRWMGEQRDARLAAIEARLAAAGIE